MSVFLKKRNRGGQLFPAPLDGAVVPENPPTLSWIADLRNAAPTDGQNAVYHVTVWDKDGRVIFEKRTHRAAATPEFLLPVGDYTWDVTYMGESRGVQTFTVPADAIEFIRPTAEEIFAGIPAGHPRLLFTPAEIPGIVATHQKELRVLRRNIEQAYRDGLPEPPRYHRDPDALPYREYFGRYRDYCDRNLVALALGYTLLGDEKAGAFARELFLTICDWNTEGPCSLCGPFIGDEIGLSNARCLPIVYDMLWPLLSDEEKRFAATVVAAYASQCERLLERLDFIANPGSSHAGRQPAYLGNAAMVLADSGVLPKEVCMRWLTFATDVYGGIFPYYGTPDGGWAEGTFYASSYTKWYLPFFSAVERYTGKSYLSRPFYRNLASFFVHFADPAKENHPFCDGYWCHPTDAEWPGFFAQDPLGIYARRYGSAIAKKMQAEVPEPELYLLHLLDVFLPDGTDTGAAELPVEKALAVFPEAGFAAMHTDLDHPEKDITCLIHATKFGGGSHRHADQGSFALFAGPDAMITPSGYFGRGYGTDHHIRWTNTTKAHNCLLIDGVGQPSQHYIAAGHITDWRTDGDGKFVETELNEAYPMLTGYKRTFRLSGNTLTVTDMLTAEEPVSVTYCLHALSLPTSDGDVAHVVRNGKALVIEPLEGELAGLCIRDEYDVPLNEGVPEPYQVEMPQQYHMYWQTPAKKEHRIVVRYTIR